MDNANTNADEGKTLTQDDHASAVGSALPTIFGVPFGQMVFELYERSIQAQRNGGACIHVCVDDHSMSEIQELLKFFAADLEILEFPAWDCLPYDRVSPNAEIMGKRVACLSALIARARSDIRKPLLILTTVNGFVQKVPPRSSLEQSSLSVKPGQRIAPDDLVAFLSGNGFERTDTVREAGEFAVRGGIVDLFPPQYEQPIRIDFFGDEVDSLKCFDPASQRSGEKTSSFSLNQAAEVVLTQERIHTFRSQYRDHFGAVVERDVLYESISQGRRYNGMEHWLPLFFEEALECLIDYVDAPLISFDLHAVQAQKERIEQIEDFFESRKMLQTSHQQMKKKSKNAKRSLGKLAKKSLKKGAGDDVSLSGAVYYPVEVDTLFLGDGQIQELIETVQSASPEAASGDYPPCVQFSPFSAPLEAQIDRHAKLSRDFKDIRALPDGDVFEALKDHIKHLQKGSERKVLIATYSEGARERLKALMSNADIMGMRSCDTMEQVKALKKGQIGLVLLGIERGFTNNRFAVLSEQDILGDRLVRKTNKRKNNSDVFIREVSSLNEGDLVVHEEHGVGRFEGLETVEAAGTLHDCVKILYGGDDRLFIPVENINVLSRFGEDSGNVPLDKLGGAGWQARKSGVKKDLMEMAGKLIEIAAARKMRQAEKLSIPEPLYQEFSSRFPYHETEDQARSIRDVVEDLTSGQPMDRLVCGDVGFGKTEVALRAAFVAGMAGVQVAIVAPTTLLARQHYAGFMERFKGFGLRIEQLSRLVSARDANLTKQGLRNGDVNIVIGTHALLSESVNFNNLGLVIVDEEQRFGVKQKERLKDLKKDVHILTLTATPIPRTLQMALTGVRDLSLMTTPPVDRLAIRNFVMPFDPMVIREAILREHHRGGQTFCVCPRIKDLDKFEAQLKELVPEVRVITAHGQMPPQDLDARVSAFYDRQYDILLATNIIESGIDVPSANTLIVYRSDLFGLAQLYQIRGRVGRSKQRAYAYLTYQPNVVLSQDAQKRLEVIDMLDTLGGGFQLASHDMDIRGAGNLVGEQQSGHIKEVGVELYHQMLEEAVAAARSGTVMDDADNEVNWTPEIQLGMSVLIPENYVKDLNVRLSLYRRLADLTDKDEIEGFAAEMIDRFGNLPDEVENLLEIMSIKQLCRKAGVVKLDAGPKGAVVTFYENQPPKPEKVLALVAKSVGTIKLRQDQKLVYTRSWSSQAQRISGVRQVLKGLMDAAS